MKMLLPIFVCLLGLCQAHAQADEEKKPARKPTLADYEKVLKYFNTWSDNLTNADHWKDVKFTNKKTKEIRKFADLSDYEKHIFYFVSAEKLSNEMKRMAGYWDEELKKFKEEKKEDKSKDDEPNTQIGQKKDDNKDDKGTKKDEADAKKKDDPLSKVATKADVEKYVGQLLEVRKKTAVRFEALTDKLFKDFKEKFTKEEIEQITKQVRDFHDKDKLIERK